MILVLPFPRIDPTAFHIGPIAIRWYALMYVLAFAMGYVLMKYRLHKQPYASITTPKPWTIADVEEILLCAMLGVLIGGRIGNFLFYHPTDFLTNPLSFFYIWQGGMSFHGGLLGVVIGIWWFAWRFKRPFLQVTDFLVPVVPIGLFFGRIGNFINGELWGRPAPTWLPWAMVFPTGGDIPRHPSQLYQALLEGLLLFILLWWYANRPRYRGQVSGAFLFGYGIFRFFAEYFREPDSFLGLLSFGLSMGQWLCLPMILLGAGMWWWAKRRAIFEVVVPTTTVLPNKKEDNENIVGEPSPPDSELKNPPHSQ